MRLWNAIVAVVVIAALSRGALAAPPDALPAADEQGARARFEQGVALLQSDAWEAALAEFLASRRLYPTAKATKNAAICLYRLGRYDEALAMTEALLREFPELPEASRREAEQDVEALKKRVGTISIEGAEPGARVSVDGHDRGEIPANGVLYSSTGRHAVRISKEGFEPLDAQVDLAAGQTTRIEARLRPIQAKADEPPAPASTITTPSPRPAPYSIPPEFRVLLEFDGGALVAPTFGGEVTGGCGDGCSASAGLGGHAVLRAGVVLRSGASFGAAAGGLFANQTITGRATSLAPVGLGVDPRIVRNPGRADDTLKLRGGLFGGWGGWSTGSKRFFELRLGAGVVVGSMGDRRTGTFQSSSGEPYSLAPHGDTSLAVFAYLDPEVRVGLRLGEHLDLGLGVQALVLVGVAQPSWSADQTVATPIDGTATFAAETTAGTVWVAILPGLGARYTF